MWTKIAHFILKNRIALISVLFVITCVLGYVGRDVEPTFKFAELVPKSDPDAVDFKAFKQTFGEDANGFAIGFSSHAITDLKNFKRYEQLIQDISKIEGLDTLVGIPNLPILTADKRKKRFGLEPLFKESPKTQEELNQKIDLLRSLKVYENQIYDKESGAHLLLISINNDYINSVKRQDIVADIEELTSAACAQMSGDVEAHFAGIPYVRTALAGKVQEELKLFLFLALGVTAVVLFIFFRSISAVIVPILIIGVAVIWTMGTVQLFGFKITLLTGLIPPIIVIIGIPNCVYLLNKYHQEFVTHGNKIKALSNVIRKIGIVTLITNCTTAIGFIVLVSAKITILREFGIVAGINVFSTFIISVILIPAIFSFLPNPNDRQLKHLEGRALHKFLEWLDFIVQNRRTIIYTVTSVIVVACSFGAWSVYSVSYMVDDIPDDDKVKLDLKYFEKNFKGVMPLEIVIDTKNKNAYTDRDLMLKIDKFEKYLQNQPELTVPVSYLTFIKAANQAYYGNDSSYFDVPSKSDKNKILSYLNRSKSGANQEINPIEKFVDSTGQIRMSIKVADIGSKKMDHLINEVVRPKAEEIFKNPETEVKITGTTLLFIKGIKFLIINLRQSLVIAIVLIAVIMALLFRSIRMIVLSLIPNLIPLLITGSLMGFLGIPLKPSTALIFSIAFGISVDDSIHFLAKFRQELFANNFSVAKSVSISIRETGSSMIYTSIILFFGFIIFSWSNFLGTRMLGILTSTTLLMAMVTNLVVLPALLLTFDNGKRNRFERRLIDQYNQQNSPD